MNNLTYVIIIHLDNQLLKSVSSGYKYSAIWIGTHIHLSNAFHGG